MGGLGNPDRPIGGLAVRTPPGVELIPLGRGDFDEALALVRTTRGLPHPATDAGDTLRGRWETLVNSADTVGFLARDAGAPAGLAIMELRRRLNFATFEGWVSDLAVPGAGGGAIGDALVAALVAEWQLRGGHRILASVPSGDDARRTALESAGFEEAFIDFRLAPIPDLDGPMPPGVRIRPLADEDADAVTRLIAEFGSRRSPVPDRMDAVLRTYAAHAREVAAGRSGSLVAELDGTTVGVCTLEWQRPFWTEELHAWVPDLVVTEPVRGRGIGRALLEAARRAARGAGATEVRLESGARRAAAHGLYRSMGFAETGHTWALRRED